MLSAINRLIALTIDERRRMKERLKKILLPAYHRLKPYIQSQDWTGQDRIFVVSMQRTGTTSTGKFLEKNGFPTAGWFESTNNDWAEKFYFGELDAIFNSRDFQRCQAFEDWPWFNPILYRSAFKRFPNSKFILFERDPKSWFQSMVGHSNGRTLGITYRHCEFFRREEDYFDQQDQGIEIAEQNGLMLEGWEDHYVKQYDIHNRRVKDFFSKNGPERLFCAKLEDEDKWERLSEFLGAKTFTGDIHINKSK